MRLLISNRPRLGEQIEVLAFESVARRLYDTNLASLYDPVTVASPQSIAHHLRAAVAEVRSLSFPERFVLSEWTQVVDAAQLRTWEAYCATAG